MTGDRAEVERLRADLAKLAKILDQVLAPAMWDERFTIRPVPWHARTVDVARGVIEVARLDEWTRTFLEVVDRNPGLPDE